MTQRAGKTLAGAARAAFRTDATILDSGLGSGIEKFCSRKNVQLIGVAPEHDVIYPRINPNDKKDNELTNGHTHFVLLGDGGASEDAAKNKTGGSKPPPAKTFGWGDESQLKFDLAKRLSTGRARMGGTTPCKIVTVLVGDNPKCHKEIEMSMNMGIPVIVLDGSPLSKVLNQPDTADKRNTVQQEAIDLISKQKTYSCPDSSEELASAIHLLLTVTFD